MNIADLKPHDGPEPEPIKATPKVRKPRKAGSVAGDKTAIVAQMPEICSNEAAAVAFFERQRWGDCPCCPRCGDTNVRMMMDKDGKRNRRFLWRCNGCKRQYTVRIGTVYEDSRIPMRHWAYAFWAACASKKGVSALQIKRMTGLNYRSALFLLNRIRHAMAHGPEHNPPKMMGTVELDETFVGGKIRRNNWRKTYPDVSTAGDRAKQIDRKTPVLAIIQRDGPARAFVLDRVNAESIRRHAMELIHPTAYLRTDDAGYYRTLGREFASHRWVKHCYGEYVNQFDRTIHNNTAEGFFSLLKRGIIGTFHQVSRKHLHRYVSEFEFRYNHRKVDDGERTIAAIRGAEGKRLTYAECIAPTNAA